MNIKGIFLPNTFHVNFGKNFDFDYYKSLSDYPDKSMSLTYKLLYLTSYLNKNYLKDNDFKEMKDNITIIKDFFSEIVDKKRDFIFDDSYLIYFVTKAAFIRASLLSSYCKDLAHYANSPDIKLYYLYSDYLNYYSIFVKNVFELNNTQLNDMFSVFFKTNKNHNFHYEVFDRFIDFNQRKQFKDFNKGSAIIDKHNYNSDLMYQLQKDFILSIIGSYCILNNCWDYFGEYVQLLNNNYNSILEKFKINGLDWYCFFEANSEDFIDNFSLFVINEIINKKIMIIK